MFKTLEFYMKQKSIKIQPKDDREIKKRDKFTKIKQKVIK
jgi:hypothetical protein